MPLPTDTPTPTQTPTATLTSTASDTPTVTATPGGPITVTATCTLHDAVTSANTDSNSHNRDCVAGSGDDTIILPAGGTTTLGGSNAAP